MHRSIAAAALCTLLCSATASAQAPIRDAVQQSVRTLADALQKRDANILGAVLDTSFRAGDFQGSMARSIIGQVIASGRIVPSSIRVDSIRPSGNAYSVHTTFALATGERSFALVAAADGKLMEIPIFGLQRTSEQRIVGANDVPGGIAIDPARQGRVGLKPDMVVDTVLRAQLDRMLEEDQRYRRPEALGNTRGIDAVREQARMDSVNVVTLQRILDTRGWPGRSVAGAGGSTAAFLVLQHAPLEIQERYVALVRDAVRQGELEASSLALLEDRIRVRKGEKQIYGSQVMGGGKVFPIEDEENVDRRRAEIGLEPLADYLRRFGIEYRR